MLRAGSRKWPPKFQVLNKAKTEKRINPASGRLAQFYTCNGCKQEYTSAKMQVDHIKPIIDPKKGFTSWDEYIDALFCESKNLQALCLDCHKEKTKKERTKKVANQKDSKD